MELLGFQYQYVPPSGRSDGVTLLLLHGTGGDEHDLLPLGRALLPGAGLLSPRGKVLEHGAPRFFRRLAEGVFDLDDLRRRTVELTQFVTAAVARNGLDAARIMAVGFSNGANIAASVLLSDPATLAGGVLFRAMVPFEPTDKVDLSGKAVLLSAGTADPLIPASGTERLEALLRDRGADVELAWQQAGHGLVEGDVAGAKRWLEDWCRGLPDREVR